MTKAPEVKFPFYRNYRDSKSHMNTSIMALLVGANLASNTLELTSRSPVTIAKIFPETAHIDRFDLTSESAQDVLNNSEAHVSLIAIPQIMSYHEHYMMRILKFAKEHGIEISSNEIGGLNLSKVHEKLEEKLGGNISPELLELVQLLRLIRNSIIHRNGEASSTLKDSISEASTEVKEIWAELVPNSPIEEVVSSDNRININAGHIILALAATKRIEREVNTLLQNSISVDEWASIAVEDFNQSTSAITNSSKWRRSLLGYVRLNYGCVEINEAQLEAAASRLGYWTKPTWT